VLAAVASAAVVALGATVPAAAVDAADFDPGFIVSDAQFYDGDALSAEEIQSFLNTKRPVCDTWRSGRGVNQPPFTCLKDYQQTVPTMPADEYCARIDGTLLSAAEIIAAVGEACSVSPKALLVLLQKEQSLVTDRWPWRTQYDHATGFSCPDSAPCDPAFAAFFSQVYSAARQFQIYRDLPERFNFRSGAQVNIQYHPNAECGFATVTIANEATAGLYNYTPYTPNAAALANLLGTGDACSSYGNRNFWRLWNEWFGSPTA
jgi:hypothetical protein